MGTTLRATTTSEPPVSHLLGRAPEDLSLRVCTGSQRGQVVRLAAQRCTIGSAPHCTLRVRHRAARPVHCLIYRGVLGTVVRRWSPDTLLNDAPFQDAPLRSGDRLQCGPLQFEVLPGRAGDAPNERPADARAGRAPDAEARRIEAERERARLARHRCRRLIMALRAARGRCVQLEWQLEEEQGRHRHARSRLDAERHDAAQQAQDAAEQLEGLGAELEESQAARDELQTRLTADQQVIEGLRQHIGDLQDELTAYKAQLAEAEERRQRATDEASQLRKGAALRAGGPAPAGAAGAAPQAEQQADEPSDGQPSIEAYMADLLERVGGRTQRLAPVAVPEDPQASRVVREAAAAPHEGVAAGREAVPDVPPAPNRAARPRSAHETAALPAMRELAKISAEHAIGQHLERHQHLRAVGKMGVALVGLAAGAVLLAVPFFQAAGGDPRLPWLLGAVSLLIGVVWGVQGSVLLWRLGRKGRSAVVDGVDGVDAVDGVDETEADQPPAAK